ncbi:MAG TPA: histidine kinase [Armatimonadota bacterium]
MSPEPLRLFLFSLQKVCVFTTLAYLLSRGSTFGRLLLYQATRQDRLRVFGFFMLLSMTELFIFPDFSLRTTTSPDVLRPIVNSSIVSAVSAGLLAGPVMGGAVGLCSALAFALLGSPSLNGGMGAALGGVLAGWVYLYRPTPRQRMVAGFVVGVISQAFWMAATLATSSAVADPVVLLATALPADVVNGLGVLTFLLIAGDLRAQQERIGSQQARRALDVANRSLPFLRQGLTEESALHIARIVESFAQVSAVSITDGKRVLAHTGAASDHHHGGRAALPLAAAEESGAGAKVGPPAPKARWREVARQSQPETDGGVPARMLRTPEEIGCPHPGCPLSSGQVSALIHEGKPIGTVEVYQSAGRPIGTHAVELGMGLAQFFSSYQMELAELERQTQIASQAELKALQSQVHPHFLFNVLNTLAALCELDPPAASRLAVRLGDFLRRSLREAPPPLIPLREELKNVHAYLEIERARFPDRLRIQEDIDEDCLSVLVPSFALQVLAENAVLHGISQKSGPGTLRLSARLKGDWAHFRVVDDGVGFTAARRAALFDTNGRASGLLTLRERGRRILGRRFRLRVVSRSGVGAAVFLAVPQVREESA